MAAKETKDGLSAKLASIDALLAKVNADAHRAMSKGASDASLKKLAKRIFGGRPLPEDVEAFFRWHDGQQKVASLSDDDHRTPMSISDAIEAWEFLSDPTEEVKQPWSKTWLPLFTNGAGDFLVYETSGKKAGSLIGYRHDDEDRAIAHESLLAWATKLEKALALEAKKARPSPKQTFAIDRSAVSWKKTEIPGKARIAKKEIGTALYYRRRNLPRQEPLWHLYVKVANDCWYHARGATLEQAFEQILEKANASKKPADYEYKTDDHMLVATEIDKESVEQDLDDDYAKSKGWTTDHVGLYEGRVKVSF